MRYIGPWQLKLELQVAVMRSVDIAGQNSSLAQKKSCMLEQRLGTLCLHATSEYRHNSLQAPAAEVALRTVQVDFGLSPTKPLEDAGLIRLPLVFGGGHSMVHDGTVVGFLWGWGLEADS